MDLIESWAIKIATEVAPHEVDLAPEMTAAYLAGGEEREQLFKHSKDGGLGGFGHIDIQSIYPTILSCVSAAGGAIVTLLSSPQVVIILGIIKSLLEIKNLSERQKKAEKELSEQNYRALKQTLDVFYAGLKSSGYSQDQCEHRTYRLLMTLLENPASAQEFVKAFSAPPKQKSQAKQKRK
jgi:hypothetical protein